MRIAYLTTDEVNSLLAAELAARHGLSLCVVEPRDGTPGPEFDAVLCDWDFWCARSRPERLAELLAEVVSRWNGPSPSLAHEVRLADLLAEVVSRPLVLHGYGVEDEEAEVLRRCGVAVFPALKAEVFQHLRRAVIAARIATAVGCEVGQEAQHAGGAA